MIRVLFIVLAVVAIALAVVLNQPYLYLVAAGLLVGAGLILTAGLRQRHRREAAVVIPPVESSENDLKAFGIMEIREKTGKLPTTGVATATEPTGFGDDAEPGDVPDHVDDDGATGASRAAGAETPPRGRADGNGPLFSGGLDVAGNAGAKASKPRPDPERDGSSQDGKSPTVRMRSRSPRIMVEGVSDAYEADVMLSVLRALRAALDATTVCLLRQETRPLSYVVEAIVSRNAFAKNGGRFIASEPLLAGRRALEPVVMVCNGESGLKAGSLGYYHEPIAIHQVSIVPLLGPHGRAPYLLIADSMELTGLEADRAVNMMTDFARLVQSFIGHDVSPSRGGSPSDDALRPRREIIAEEMDSARESDKPLALALVYLNRAENVGKDGEAAVRTTESELLLALQGLSDGGRVERFGELTFGVFQKKDADETARWAAGIKADMARQTGALVGGVSVGVAMLGDRHDGPDKLRSDATNALMEAFETGDCVVL